MLVGKERTVARRVRVILLATAGVTLGFVLAAWLLSFTGAWDWPPKPSSAFGVWLGLIGGAIVLFEMALMLRKRLRGRRWGISARAWMKLHVWLGLVCLPVILVHAGFGFGGPLTTVTLVLFLLVTVSGIWGLIMQQWLPQKMLADVPGETVVPRVEDALMFHASEAERLIDQLTEAPPEFDEHLTGPLSATSSTSGGSYATGAETGAVAPVTGAPAAALRGFRDLLLPYLRGGRSPLSARGVAEQQFARLRGSLPVVAHPALARLEGLCDQRRRWERLRWLNAWLHNWLVVHVPLSVAMTVLMLLHAVRALKYW